MPARTAKPVTVPRPTCLRVDCDDPATVQLVPPYGVPWRGCADHYPAMVDALYIGQAATTADVRIVHLSPTQPESAVSAATEQTAIDDGTAKPAEERPVPASVHRDTVRRFIEQLGLSPLDVVSLTVAPSRCEVELFQRDPEQGNKIITRQGGYPVTRTVEIPVV